MTNTAFITLTTPKQLELLQTLGVYLSKRKIGSKVVLLYEFNGFYVELYYKKYRQLIDYICCSDETDILSPYLDEIDITGIFDETDKTNL